MVESALLCWSHEAELRLCTPCESMSRILLFASSLLAFASACTQPKPPEPRPLYNVLMIGVDTLRANHLGAYGYDRPTSPKIDAFFETAVVFDDAHSVSSWTLPSFASIMTSLHSSTHGCWQFSDSLRPRYKTLAECLQDAGYRTGAAVSHVFMRKQFGLHQGFKNYDESLAKPGLGESDKLISSPGLTEKAITFIEHSARATPDEPWLMWVHYFDPHWFYQTHEGLTEAFGEEHMDRYDSEIAFTDRHIGKLLDRIDELGLTEKTIVVFVSDHGEEFKDHGGNLHGRTLFTEVERIPFAIRYPGIEPRRVQIPVSGVDVMPTVLGLLDLPLPKRPIAGRTLEPLMRGEELADRGVLLESRLLQRQDVELEAFVTEEWKLILEHPREGSGLEGTNQLLFDRKSDPTEQTDIAAEHPGVVEALADSLRDRVEAAIRMNVRKDGALPVNLTPEQIADLKALGYVGDLPDENFEEDKR